VLIEPLLLLSSGRVASAVRLPAATFFVDMGTGHQVAWFDLGHDGIVSRLGVFMS